MANTVIAISGKIGSGKSTLATIVAEGLGISKVSFGDFVRFLAIEKGLEPSRENLQALGQEQVDFDAQKFCSDVLQFGKWKAGRSIVIDGVRHIKVLEALRNVVSPTPLKLVYLDPEEEIRRERIVSRDGISPLEISQFDNDRTESESDELRDVADLIVNNANTDSVERVKKILADC